MGPIFLFVSILSLTSLVNSMIITSVLGGPKKYKTVSFDFLPFPLVWSSRNKWQFAVRGHHTLRRPFFNVNMATPVTLPLDFLPPPPQYSSDTAEYASPSEESTDLAPDQSETEDTVIPDQKKEYVGYDSNSNIPRPYTGKAQVSSFIDNGQFVHANSGTNSASQDAAFGDDTDRRVNGGPPDTLTRRFDKIKKIKTLKKGKTVALLGSLKKKGKTIALGYETLGEPSKLNNPIKTHNMHPDSMPWGMDYDGWQKYYTTFQVMSVHR